MSWDKGLNFRATELYVSDGTNETFVLGDGYPVTRNSVTFGWVSGLSGTANRLVIDARLAGINYRVNDGTQATFQVDLPSTGVYDIWLALGDAGSIQAYSYIQLKDNTTAFATITDTDGTAAAQWDDATATNRTEAQWLANSGFGSAAKVTRTFTSTILNVVLGSPSAQADASCLANIFISQVSGGTTPVSLLAIGIGG